MTVDESSWLGLGAGHGHLTARRVEVLVTGRGKALRPRRTPLWLPDHSGRVASAEHRVISAEHRVISAHERPALDHPALVDVAYEAAG